MKEYDVCVIGAGSAGLVAATTANRLGAKTSLVESNIIGGECLNSGCIPSKTFLYSANLFYNSRKAGELGLPTGIGVKPDLGKIMEYVRKLINSMAQSENEETFQKMGIDVYLGRSYFVSKNILSVNGKEISSKYFIICTGSLPIIPHIDTLQNVPYLTNENFWDQDELPLKTLIMGAGPIGIELGQALSRLGSEVYIATRSDAILKKEDDEIALETKKILMDEGLKFLNNVRIKQFEKDGSQIIVRYDKNGMTFELAVDTVLAAIGRKPNIAKLDLENAGVKYKKEGIIVNDELKTTAENIYACGDVLGKYLFTHAASYYAEIAVNNILKTEKITISQIVMPWVTFTDPEIAHIGMTEKEAREKFTDINLLYVDATLDRFRTENTTKGFLKIILDKNDAIIGAHALGAHAGEYIQNLTLAMQHNITIQQLSGTIYPYPTFSEIVKKAFSRYLRTKT
jgi:pyruvate/2-oxoglutarate dehydrogenase complex dihydrolipoamide dehydrogenase (E3) component